MSPKDLCTIHFLNKMVDAGIRIFKIEGRARPPEYVYEVTRCYHDALNSIAEGTYNKEKIEQWQARLKTVFNRGFWDGYYLGQRLGEWSEVYGSKATQHKVYVGKSLNYFSNIKVAEFFCEASELHVGETVVIMGPTTGFIKTQVEEIRVDLRHVEKATQGVRFSIPVDTVVRRSDKLYKMVAKEADKIS
jgi:putative protease